MKKKSTRGRTATGRTTAIYPRVQPTNSEWLERVATKSGKSQAETVDHLLSYIRRNYTMSEVQDQIVHTNGN